MERELGRLARAMPPAADGANASAAVASKAKDATVRRMLFDLDPSLVLCSYMTEIIFDSKSILYPSKERRKSVLDTRTGQAKQAS